MIKLRATNAAWQIGTARGFNGFDRTATAGAFNHANDRQAQFIGHAFRHDGLFANGRIRAAAAHREIIAQHHHRAAINLRTAHDAVGRGQALQIALGVIFAAPGNGANFVEAILVHQLQHTFAHREPPAIMLALHLIRPAHGLRHGLAALQLLDFRLPSHAAFPLVSFWRRVSREFPRPASGRCRQPAEPP